MNHDRYSEQLQLMLYGELDEAERAELESHLSGCARCSAELASLKQFHALLSEHPPAEMPEIDLLDARRRLRGSLRDAPRPLLERLLPAFVPRLAPAVRFALGGAFTLAVGVYLGTLLVRPVSPQGPPPSAALGTEGDVRISNVRFLATDPANGEIEFFFDAVKPVHMKGNINDGVIQKVLTHAMLNEENPGVRLRSVSAIASGLNGDAVVRNALIAAMKGDENPGVRREALEALRKYPFDAEVKSAFLFVLTHDANPGLRIAAINQLGSSSINRAGLDQELLNVLKDKIHSDNNNYIRLRAKAVIEETRQ